MGRGHPYWRSALPILASSARSAVPWRFPYRPGDAAPLCQGCCTSSPCRHRGGAGGLGSPGSGGLTWAVLVEGAERAQRRELIVNAARELAESEGWEAVTTRRLADRIEYSQPVLYSHFEDKHAIVSAVASRGLGGWPRYRTTRTRGPVRLLQSSERWPTPTSRDQDSTAVDTAH